LWACRSLSDLTLIYCGKAEFGQILRFFSLNSIAIRLKKPNNLPQIDFPSPRSVKSDRLPGAYFCDQAATVQEWQGIGLPGNRDWQVSVAGEAGFCQMAAV